MPNPFTESKKYRNESLPLEDIDYNVKYSMTINMEKITGNIKTDYDHYNNQIRSCLDHPGIQYEFYYEFSPIGRLHVHGTLLFTTPIGIAMFYQNLHTLQKIATFSFDYLKDNDVWDKYLQKQQHVMKPYFRALGLKPKTENAVIDISVKRKRKSKPISFFPE